MKNALFLIVFFLAANHAFCQTQLDMDQSAGRDYQTSDSLLNDVYHKILRSYRSDTAFINNLKTSERIWVQFRDAEMKMKYPAREAGTYGSVFPVCWAIYLKGLTDGRTETLKVWLTGIEEGDACSGSVNMKKQK
jgi:uncharacterized protein YecT (DUF1311 family)